MTTINLREPWWGAGTSLGWDTKDKVGFGIAKKIIDAHDEFMIKTPNWGTFTITKTDIIAFAKTHGVRYTRKGVELIVVPREICQISG